jgi:hypothetical protein
VSVWEEGRELKRRERKEEQEGPDKRKKKKLRGRQGEGVPYSAE